MALRPLLVALVLLVAGGASAGDRYQEQWTRAQELAAEGKTEQAVAVLGELAKEYPQDTALQIELAWLHFKRGAYESAAVYYRRAMELSPESDDAASGLGWSLLYMGRKRAAREVFLSVLERNPDHTGAQDGLRLSTFKHIFSLGAVGLVHLYDGHPTKESAMGLVLGGHSLLWEAMTFGGAYRYTRFSASTGTDAGDMAYEFAQHEGSVYLGYLNRTFGGSLHYHYADGGGADNYAVHSAGLLLRLDTWGSAVATGTASWYDDQTVYRASLEYLMPLTHWLSLKPGAIYQNADGEHLGAGTLQLETRLSGWTASLGGRYGLEKRPLSLLEWVVFNSDDDLSWGLWTSVGYGFQNGIRLAGGYELHHLETPVDEETIASNLHLFYLSLSWVGSTSNNR